MKTAVKLAILFCCFSVLRISASAYEIIEFDDTEFQVLQEDPDDPFTIDVPENDRRSLGGPRSYIRDRQDHIIIENEGESEKFFEENPPQSESDEQARSGQQLPYRHFRLEKNHRGGLRDERRREIVSAKIIEMIQKYIVRRRSTSYPHVMIFPEGGRLGCLQPVFITWGHHNQGHCCRPVCRPHKKRHTRKPTSTKKPTSRCVKVKKVCVPKDRATKPSFQDISPVGGWCDPAIEDCGNSLAVTTESPFDTTSTSA